MSREEYATLTKIKELMNMPEEWDRDEAEVMKEELIQLRTKKTESINVVARSPVLWKSKR